MALFSRAKIRLDVITPEFSELIGDVAALQHDKKKAIATKVSGILFENIMDMMLVTPPLGVRDMEKTSPVKETFGPIVTTTIPRHFTQQIERIPIYTPASAQEDPIVGTRWKFNRCLDDGVFERYTLADINERMLKKYNLAVNSKPVLAEMAEYELIPGVQNALQLVRDVVPPAAVTVDAARQLALQEEQS